MINISNFNKNGVITSDISESLANNILDGQIYTADNPYVLSGTGEDIIAVTSMVQKVTPGKKYYLTCKTDKEWSTAHGASESTHGKVVIWLYIKKVYNPDDRGYEYAKRFHRGNTTDGHYIRDGLWCYTIDEGYNMARVRFNTYSADGSLVTAKFWDVALIPEEDFTDSCKINDNKVIADKLIES